MVSMVPWKRPPPGTGTFEEVDYPVRFFPQDHKPLHPKEVAEIHLYNRPVHVRNQTPRSDVMRKCTEPVSRDLFFHFRQMIRWIIVWMFPHQLNHNNYWIWKLKKEGHIISLPYNLRRTQRDQLKCVHEDCLGMWSKRSGLQSSIRPTIHYSTNR